MSYPFIRYSKPLVLIFLLTVICILLPSLYKSRSISSMNDVCSIEDTNSCLDEDTGDLALHGIQIDLSRIVYNIRKSIRDSAKSYDEDHYTKDLGFKIKYQSLSEYQQHLQSTYNHYFTSSKSNTDLFNGIASYLSIIPSSSAKFLPKNVYTTSLEDSNALPDQFNSWTSNNEDWNIRFVNDDEIDSWLNGIIPFSKLVEAMKWLKDDGRWGVVRSDLFRYLVLLLDGGVYTDTDTACIRPISQWGSNALNFHFNNPLIEALPQLLSLSKDNENSKYPNELENIEDSPSLIIALENDSPASGSDWKADTFVRGLQVVQWTIAAKKGHPILLDVIGHALNKVEELRKAQEGDVEVNDEQEILEWSGPGAFTDAVFRYLLIRYGFHPNQASGLDRPLRIGDVLIMPVHSFRADASEGYQGDNQVVWHGFFGRWKSD
ncbi:uncharacterized protein I206_104797 [Kwoniella pini CBS 10737]|uniref:Alpha-1,6-mannosyltransferase n=1 Tax=Kwoniella pini CBS 10737 TaxID=1296096 RepID=A0AAJ8L761_9TREE